MEPTVQEDAITPPDESDVIPVQVELDVESSVTRTPQNDTRVVDREEGALGPSIPSGAIDSAGDALKRFFPELTFHQKLSEEQKRDLLRTLDSSPLPMMPSTVDQGLVMEWDLRFNATVRNILEVARPKNVKFN